MELLIRKIISEDFKEISRLMNHDLKLGLNTDPDIIQKQIGRMNAAGNYFLKAAMLENQIVGFVAAYKALILEMPDEYVRIIGLAVKTGFRRRGIGKRLVDEVVRYAKQCDAAYIALNSTLKAEEDHIVYNALGFEKKSFGFSKSLL